ncbi:MAG: phage minor head protein, partial [Ginsengibacter sp.]
MTKSEQIEWSKTFRKFQSGREKAWAPKIYSALRQMIRDATSEDTLSAAISRIDRNITFDKLGEVIRNIYIDAGRVFGARAYQLVRNQTRKNVGAEGVKAMLPMGQNEQLINDIITYFQLHLLNRAVIPITETMKAWILDRLIDAQTEGRSITQVVDDLEAHEFPRNRAFLIARTESLKSANFGAKLGFVKAGYKTNKIWISATDDRTRRIPRDQTNHLTMNGTEIGLDDKFKVPDLKDGYDEMDHPGDTNAPASQVCNCRCVIGARVLSDANG